MFMCVPPNPDVVPQFVSMCTNRCLLFIKRFGSLSAFKRNKRTSSVHKSVSAGHTSKICTVDAALNLHTHQ